MSLPATCFRQLVHLWVLRDIVQLHWLRSENGNQVLQSGVPSIADERTYLLPARSKPSFLKIPTPTPRSCRETTLSPGLTRKSMKPGAESTVASSTRTS